MNYCAKLICTLSLFSLISSSCSTYKDDRDRDRFPTLSSASIQSSLDVDVETAEYRDRDRDSSSLDVEPLSCAIPIACSDYPEHIEEYFNLPSPTVDVREYRSVCEGDNLPPIIPPIQQLSITDEEIEMLKYVVEQETRGGSYRHKCIVTNVILNRVRDSRFPNTVKEVLLQKGQFSSLWNYYQKRREPDEKTERAVNDVLNGRVEDESRDSLFFHSMKSDGWFSSLSFVMEVEGHRFFK